MQVKKVPIRKCSGCGEQKSKKELIRVVKSPDGVVSLDLTGKKSGRGAYLCHNIDCLKKARKTKKFEREFSCQIPPDVLDAMETTLLSEVNTI